MIQLTKSGLLIFLLLLMVNLTGCLKNDGCDNEVQLNVNQEQLEADIEAIDTWLSENDINAEVHSSGLRYVVNAKGEGKKPSLCNNVAVTYQGRLLSNGESFDGTDNPVAFSLSQLIKGWQLGIPLIKNGGSITLYIPSVYGYGTGGSGDVIPPNANLIFEIELVDVW